MREKNVPHKIILSLWVVLSLVFGWQWMIENVGSFDFLGFIIDVGIAMLIFGIPAAVLYKIWE